MQKQIPAGHIINRLEEPGMIEMLVTFTRNIGELINPFLLYLGYGVR